MISSSISDTIINSHVTNTVISISVISLLIAYSIFWFFDARYYDMNGKRLPGPINNFFYPNITACYMEGRKHKQGTKKIIEDILYKYGDGSLFASIIRWSGTKIVVTSNPDHAKVVLSGGHTKFPKSRKYGRLKFFLGEGLVTSSNEKWSSHRRLINPGFHAETIKRLITLNVDVASEFIASILHATPNVGDVVKLPMNRELSRIALEIISRAAFGFSSKSKVSDEFNDYLNIINNEMNDRLIDHTDWWYKMFPERKRKTDQAVTFIQEILKSCINERLASRNGVNTDGIRANDLLDILIDANNASDDLKFSHNDFRDHCVTFFVAGFETTTAALSWILYELCLHPTVLEKCHQEVDNLFNRLPTKTSSEISYEDIMKMDYLNQVVKESMRLHPPVSSIARITTEPVSLGEYLLSPKTVISLSILAMHRNPLYWSNPDVFDPDRWSAENIHKTLKSPFQYAPFSHGPRNCIGQRFAQMEMMVVLTVLLRYFSVSMDAEDHSSMVYEDIITCQPRVLNMSLLRRV